MISDTERQRLEYERDRLQGEIDRLEAALDAAGEDDDTRRIEDMLDLAWFDLGQIEDMIPPERPWQPGVL